MAVQVSSLYGPSSINFQINTSDKFCLVGREEKDGIGNIINLTETAQRYIAEKLLAVLWCVWDSGE